MCVCVCVAHSCLSSPHPVTRYRTAVRDHSGRRALPNITATTQTTMTTEIHVPLKGCLFGTPDELMHPPPQFVSDRETSAAIMSRELSYGAGVPPPHPFCRRVKTQTGKINAQWQKRQGQTLAAACTEWYRVSIFFSLNDKPNCDPFYTQTGNLRDIHLGGLFIYEQVPENRLLTPRGIAV